jgi:hypothetical protein
MASKWDDIHGPKILDALRVALSDDKMFSHREVVDVVRAALDDGILTPGELNDLRIVAEKSETMLARPKARNGLSGQAPTRTPWVAKITYAGIFAR